MKKINYLEKPATAVHFYNMTQHVNQVRLESQILEEKNRNVSLQSYTSTISHEFRTPLSTSLMFLANLLETNLPQGTISVIQLIVSQLNLLLCLVNDVLDMKLIQEGVFKPKFERFQLQKTLDFIVAMFDSQSKMQGTKIVAETVKIENLTTDIAVDQAHAVLPHCALPVTFMGDQIRLKQILINLVKNSLKFCRNGIIRILVGYNSAEEHLMVQIVDTGKGIKAEDMHKLFKMFGKLHRTADQNSEGIGMGLMICQNLVRLSGG